MERTVRLLAAGLPVSDDDAQAVNANRRAVQAIRMWRWLMAASRVGIALRCSIGKKKTPAETDVGLRRR
jgi:hypothetical protein